MSDTHELKLVWPETQPSEVIATGTFDKWSSSVRLSKSAQGFTGSVHVPWGEKVLFKFVVDGRWRTLESELTERDWIGNLNNVYQAPHKPPVAEKAAAAPSADVVSTLAATDGTTSVGQYIASGVGQALKGIIGVDPINSEPIPLATPKAEIDEPAAVVEPAAPAPAVPIVPAGLSPVNDAANNIISPVNADDVHTHSPVIMPRRASGATPTQQASTPAVAPAGPLGPNPTTTSEPIINGNGPSPAVASPEAIVNGGDTHTHNPVVMPRRVSATTTPVPDSAEPAIHAHTNGNGNGALKVPESKKDEETTPKAAPIALEEPPIVPAEEPLPTTTAERVVAEAEAPVVAEAEEPVVAKAEEPVVAEVEAAVVTKAEEPTTPKAKEASLDPVPNAPSTPARAPPASPTTKSSVPSTPSTPVRSVSSRHQFPSESPTPSSVSRFSTATSTTRKKRHSFFGRVKSLFEKSPKKE